MRGARKKGGSKKSLFSFDSWFAFFENLEIHADAVSASYRHEKGSDRINRFTLLTNNFANVSFFNTKFNNQCVRATNFIDFNFVWIVDEVFDDVFNKFLHGSSLL